VVGAAVEVGCAEVVVAARRVVARRVVGGGALVVEGDGGTGGGVAKANPVAAARQAGVQQRPHEAHVPQFSSRSSGEPSGTHAPDGSGQPAQAERPADAAKVPLGQGVQAEALAVAEKVPSGQGVHGPHLPSVDSTVCQNRTCGHTRWYFSNWMSRS
jgi:hypothetical protein